MQWVRAAWAVMLALAGADATAIEAPAKSQPSPPPAAATHEQAIALSDPQALQALRVRAAHGQRLANLKIESSVIDALASGDVAKAVALLSARAETNDPPSNIALVRIQNWCSRLPPRERHRDLKLLEQLRQQLTEDEVTRLQKIVDLELNYEAAALQSCQRAQFDYRLIEAQLREAADAGEPLSVTELARIETRPERVEALLQQAVSKNYAPAQYALAMSRLVRVQRGELTQNVGTIRVLLKQAGRTLSRAKLDLANCMATGCEGHPGDADGAMVFGLDAARDGERDAFASIARMPWAARLSMEQRLAWQYFGQRLNEAGCFGENYLPMFALLRENVIAYERVVGAAQAQAAKLADQYWAEFASRAQREQHCSPN